MNRCGFVDRLPDSQVRSAAAKIPGHGVINFLIRWFRFFRKQRGRRHHLPRLTVAALRDVNFLPSYLYGVCPSRG